MWVILHIFAASVIVRMLHREYSKGAKLLIFFQKNSFVVIFFWIKDQYDLVFQRLRFISHSEKLARNQKKHS